MLVTSVRSGVTEVTHHVSAVVVDAEGRRVATWGDPEQPWYLRSAAKPLQATVSQEEGADLVAEWLAVACASHGGHPVHLAMVRAMLDDARLTEADLGCPPDWPLSSAARDRIIAGGDFSPRRLFHNCSGKHAAMLRACRARGWPLAGYLDPTHPLQQRVIDLTHETTGVRPEPVGIDGCGAPVLLSTLHGVARAFSRISTLDRFAEVADAMSRFPALVADNTRSDGRIAAWWGGPLKVGAEGLIAAGRHGIGIAIKAHSGSGSAAAVGMMEVARQLDLLPTVAMEALASVSAVPVYGGGHVVGSMSVEHGRSAPTPDDEPRP